MRLESDQGAEILNTLREMKDAFAEMQQSWDKNLTEIRQSLDRNLSASVRLKALRDRYEMYQSLHTITEDDLEITRSLLEEYFDENPKKEFQNLTDASLRRILAMHRMYEYMHYSMSHQEILKEAMSIPELRLELWIEEVGVRKEFQLAHIRQGRYYPAFARKVNQILYARGMFLISLEEAVDSEQAQSGMHQAQSMIDTSLQSEAESWFYRYRGNELSEEEEGSLEEVFRSDNLSGVPLDVNTFTDSLLRNKEFLESYLEKEHG